MAKVPFGVDAQGLDVVARRVLLDTVEALANHRDAVTIVGGQAVFLRTPDVVLAVASYTSDGDVGLDPELLVDVPLLEQAMEGSGFTREVGEGRSQPGTWLSEQAVDGRAVRVAVDLLTPEALTAGGRGARLPPHDKGAVRRVPGLELVVVDRDLMTLTSLEPARDARAFKVHVAGVAALLGAKAHKIGDRVADANSERLSDKDAGDVLRLMIGSSAADVGATFLRLIQNSRVGGSAAAGLEFLERQFSAPRAVGVDMAVRALALALPEATVRAVAPAFMAELRREVSRPMGG